MKLSKGSDVVGGPNDSCGEYPLSLLAKTPIKAPKIFLPFYAHKIAAGFPSPADDYIDSRLDLNDYLIEHPAATFLLRVKGDSMEEAGILPGDVLIVDRSLEAKHGNIVIAMLNSEFTVKRLHCRGKRVKLLPANCAYAAIDITEAQELIIWGVVTHVIHKAT